jgi:hypothetical protein
MKADKLLTPTTAATTISISTKATTINNTLNSKRPTVIVYPTGECWGDNKKETVIIS